MAEEIDLTKKSKAERLAIANTLLDGVTRDTDSNLISKTLNQCMEDITDCIAILERLGE